MRKICVDCDNPFETNITVDGKRFRGHKRIRCYECKPYGGKTGIRSKTLGKNSEVVIFDYSSEERFCKICSKTIRRSTRASSGATCSSCLRKIRTLRRRIWCMEYKKGACEHCGLKSDLRTDIVLFDFHHFSDAKDFEISKSIHISLPKLKRELDKCILLCALCHRKVHYCDPQDAIYEVAIKKKNPLLEL